MKITGLWQKLLVYLKQVKVEGKKINWPTREKTMSYSLIVIIIAIVVAVFLGGLDFIFSSGVKFLIRIFS
jgi:preprotein translocase subunit SecE